MLLSLFSIASYGKCEGAFCSMKKPSKLSLDELHKLVKEGFSHCGRAEFEIAERYYLGNGVKQSNDKALEWYKSAHEQLHGSRRVYDCDCGFVFCKSCGKDSISEWTLAGRFANLSECYYQGRDCEQSYEKAVECFCLSCEYAFERPFSIFYTENTVPYYVYLISDCYKYKNSPKIKSLINNYQSFVRGGYGDMDEKVIWKNVVRLILGSLYYDGILVDKNLEKAETYYRRAGDGVANSGCLIAKKNLVNCYYQQGENQMASRLSEEIRKEERRLSELNRLKERWQRGQAKSLDAVKMKELLEFAQREMPTVLRTYNEMGIAIKEQEKKNEELRRVLEAYVNTGSSADEDYRILVQKCQEMLSLRNSILENIKQTYDKSYRRIVTNYFQWRCSKCSQSLNFLCFLIL